MKLEFVVMASGLLLALSAHAAAMDPLRPDGEKRAGTNASDARRADSAPANASLIVAYKHEGKHALEACAEATFEKRRFFAAASADRSLSLDLWHLKHRVRHVRALFRRSDARALDRQAASLRARLSRVSTNAPDLSHVYAVELSDARKIGSALTELRNDPHVAYAQLDSVVRADFVPNDPFLTSSGSWGQPFADLWGLERIGALQAWQTSLGEKQVVAVVDSGVDYTHPDLATNVWVNPGEDLNGNGRVDPSDQNGVDDDENGFVDDLRGYDFVGFGEVDDEGFVGEGDPDPFDEFRHGTHVAGTIAAVADNGIGIAGVAPRSKIMALRGLDENGRGKSSHLWRAVLYAIENGADVINASWSCSPSCPDNPLAEEVLALAKSAGVVFVTSAGNSSFDVIRNSPENSNLAITVGSSGQDDSLSSFSNRGWLIDLVAPGGDGPRMPNGPLAAHRNILSLAASSVAEVEAPFIVDELYFRLAGTSMSAPHVAGAVALLRSLRPELGPDAVRRMLRIASRDLGRPGHDAIYGGGGLDLVALLEIEPPDLELALDSPVSSEIVDPNAGPVRIAVRAEGADLRSFSISVSRGIDTAEFVEIARGVSSDPARVIEWDASQEPTGPRVLRLSGVLRDGRVVEEYAVFALERVQPFQLSDGEEEAVAPDISGRRVVWQSLPADRDRSEIRIRNFAARRGTNESQTISRSELAQSAPRLEGRRVIWQEFDAENEDRFVVGCQTTGRSRGGCRSRVFAAGDTQFISIEIGGGRVLWSELIGSRLEILGCLWKGGRRASECEARAVDGSRTNSSHRLLDFDGRTALLATLLPFDRIEICSPAIGETPCENRPLLVEGLQLFARHAAFDGSLLAFELEFVGRVSLGHCLFDAETGTCSDPRILDLGDATPQEPVVSGNRIAWTQSRTGEVPSVAYCEVDSITRDCRPVRLTGTPYSTSHVRIDGRRLVWQDERLGASQIFGLELPEFAIGSRFTAMRGHTKQIRFAIFPGGDEAMALSLESVSGPSPEAWNARLDPIRGRKMALLIRPPETVPTNSTAVWQIVGRTSSGLETRRRIEIELR